jgi:methylamine utilization protein MauE
MTILRDPAVHLFAALGLGLVFGASAASKMTGWPEFIGAVQNYHLLPGAAVRPFGYTLPLVEAATAVGLLFAGPRPYAAGIGIALLALFSLAIGVNIARGRRHIDCGCFRVAFRQPLGWALVGRNVALSALALLAMSPEVVKRPLAWLDLVTVGGAATALLFLHLAGSYVLGPAPPDPRLAGEGARA